MGRADEQSSSLGSCLGADPGSARGVPQSCLCPSPSRRSPGMSRVATPGPTRTAASPGEPMDPGCTCGTTGAGRALSEHGPVSRIASCRRHRAPRPVSARCPCSFRRAPPSRGQDVGDRCSYALPPEFLDDWPASAGSERHPLATLVPTAGIPDRLVSFRPMEVRTARGTDRGRDVSLRQRAWASVHTVPTERVEWARLREPCGRHPRGAQSRSTSPDLSRDYRLGASRRRPGGSVPGIAAAGTRCHAGIPQSAGQHPRRSERDIPYVGRRLRRVLGSCPWEFWTAYVGATTHRPVWSWRKRKRGGARVPAGNGGLHVPGCAQRRDTDPHAKGVMEIRGPRDDALQRSSSHLRTPRAVSRERERTPRKPLPRCGLPIRRRYSLLDHAPDGTHGPEEERSDRQRGFVPPRRWPGCAPGCLPTGAQLDLRSTGRRFWPALALPTASMANS